MPVRVLQPAVHAVDKGMKAAIAVEAVEPKVHGAEGGCVQGEAGEIAGWIDGIVWPKAGPLNAIRPEVRGGVVMSTRHFSSS